MRFKPAYKIKPLKIATYYLEFSIAHRENVEVFSDNSKWDNPRS